MATTTTLEIHPAIGIARVGASTEFFFGPEQDTDVPERDRRDSSPDKLLKRQAARFRVYSCTRDENGALVQCEELTPDKAEITWTVHLANRKAAGPRFLTDDEKPNTDRSLRRNEATGNDVADAALIIDGGRQTLAGASQGAKAFRGQFKGQDVPLGEASTDAAGRLVVVGGFGRSASFPTTPLTNFADNDGWHDDTSDGPVEATVHFLDGRPAKPVEKNAWVICCQPDFAPGIRGLVSLYDAFIDVAVTRGVLPLPGFRPAYDRDVLPILQRALGYQWVNRFNRAAHSAGGPGDFLSIADIGDPAADVPDRKVIFGLLRDPAGPATPPGRPAMPALFSDDYFTDKRLVQPLTRAQYRIMKEWAAGNFDASGERAAEGEADALTRVVLEACVGASFCPGIEAGRRIRDASIYAPGEVFRFDHAKLRAGELTESMALPWQADFALCRWEQLDGQPQKKGRGWWPSQRPDHVLTAPDAASMVDWDRGASSMAQMVDHWHELGTVLETKTEDGATTFVEMLRTRQAT